MRFSRTEVLTKSVQPTKLVFTKRDRDEIADELGDLAFVKQEKWTVVAEQSLFTAFSQYYGIKWSTIPVNKRKGNKLIHFKLLKSRIVLSIG